MPKRCRGFTLLEILVVMVLTSMVAGILLFGLQQIFRLQAHFGNEVFHAHHEAMQVEWFRQTVRGLMPDYPDGARKFKGAPRRMSGQTTSPLNAPEGALMPLVWRIEFDPRRGATILYQGEGPEAQEILSWEGSAGRFVYFDGEGRPHDEWPPFLGEAAQLPSLVQLEAGGKDRGRSIVVAPRGPDKPWPRQRDVLAG